MISTNKIISFVLIYFLCYFCLYLVYQKTVFGLRIQKVVYTIVNKHFTDCFEDTRIFAQALNRKPLDCQIGKAKFQLVGADPVKGFDTRLNFVNSKKLHQRVEESLATGKSNAQVDMHNFNFSTWSFIGLPFTVLLSLWIASMRLVHFSLKRFMFSIITLTGFVGLLFFLSLGYMRQTAPLMEPFEVPQWWKNFLNEMFFLQAVEFSYISTMILFILFAYRSFLSLFK
jgi:hypothetical protein